jgi:NADH-quinone oxidoreductase subunit E
VRSTRGPEITTWREAERVLAGFPDDLADEGPSAGAPSLVGLGIARERGWTAPDTAGGSAPRSVSSGSASEGAAEADTARAGSETVAKEDTHD